MASTFENNLRLEEIGTGEQSGTWGTKTNVNLELITDGLSYSSTGEAIANASTHTITMADGVADEFRSFYLKCTGGGQACTVTLAPNTLSKVWVIENTTSYTLTFSQGSGANVAILAGQVKMIATDGAGSGAAVFDLMQDLAVPDLFVDDDLKLQSDGAVLGFGADNDVTLTHVADTGLLLNSTMAIQFNDASQFINAPSATVLDINATDEIELNATLVDINANLDVSGTITGTGTSVFASLDISGDIDVDGTTNLDVVDIDGAVQLDNTLTVGVDDTGYDVKFFGASASHFLLWDESADELVLAADSKLSFNDAAGGENIVASTDGHLEVNAGTTLDVTAPTVQINASSVFDVNGNIDVSGTYTGGGLMTTGGNIVIPDAGNIGSASDTDAIAIASDGQVTLTQTLTGTAANFSGVATATTFEPDGDTAAGDNAAIGYTAAEGLILTGQGSTNDVTIKNDADADVLEIPTGTTNVTIAGNLGVGGTVTSTGTSVFASLDISGDIDVDGTTNLDATDINGALTISPNTAGKDTFTLTTNASNDGRFLIKSDTTTKVDIQANGTSFFNGGNVGIGTAPDFPLHVSSTGVVFALNSTSGAVAQRFNENGTARFFINTLDGSNGIKFVNGDGTSERMRISSAGNVGINDSTPTEGKLVVRGDANTNALMVGGNSTTGQSYGALVNAGTNSSDAAFRIYDQTGSNPYVFVRGDGNVGISASSPSAKLEIDQGSASSPLALKITGSSSPALNIVEATGVTAHVATDNAAVYVGSSTSHPLVLRTNNSERVRVDTSGRVGIGGTPNTNWRNDIADQEVLMLGTEATLYSDAGVTTALLNNVLINNADTFVNISERGASQYFQYQGAHKWYTAASASAGSSINTEFTTPKMTLDVSGNLGLGTDSPSSYLATKLVIGCADEQGMTLAALSSSTKQNIYFADGTSGSARNRGNVSYDHNLDELSMGTASGSQRFIMGSTGTVTIPSQPAFLVQPASQQDNIAGTGATVVFGTERFDQNADFASNTFTAPVTGKYQFNVNLLLLGVDADINYYTIKLTTSNRTYFYEFDPDFGQDPARWTVSFGILADMDASDTATVVMAFSPDDVTSTVDIATESTFSGFLAC